MSMYGYENIHVYCRKKVVSYKPGGWNLQPS